MPDEVKDQYNGKTNYFRDIIPISRQVEAYRKTIPRHLIPRPTGRNESLPLAEESAQMISSERCFRFAFISGSSKPVRRGVPGVFANLLRNEAVK